MKLFSLFISTAALFAACASPFDASTRPDLLGVPAPVSAATRTIVIAPGTRYVNVTGGETIMFIVGDKTFAWNFNVAQTIRSFDLSQTAPPGMLDHQVIAYVAPNPLYFGRGGHGGHGHGGGK